MTDRLLRPAGSTRAWRRLRLACLDRDGWRCQVEVEAGRRCLLPADTADHITPRAAGGADVLDNLRAACARHNYGRRGDGPAPRPGAARQRPWAW